MNGPYPDDNPKTAVGATKPPLHFIPPSSLIALGAAMENGGEKYGLMNWRKHRVSSSVYYNAMLRHALEWWDGDDIAEDSLVSHLGHVMACCAILIDAIHTGQLNDDRPSRSVYPDRDLPRVSDIIRSATVARRARQEDSNA